ncbi:MAG: iron-containing redox enzyme family protein [Cyanobacteriota bacterium]
MTFFTALSSHLQRTLQQSGRERRLQSGELLIRQGDCDCTLYLLQSGTLQVLTASGQGASIPVCSGEVVGEMAFLDNRPRTATVVAAGPCTVLALDRQTTFQRLSDHPLVLHELITGLAALQRSRLQELAALDSREHHDIVEALAEEARHHRAVLHPYLLALSTGQLPDLRSALADFAQHYYGYSAHFPRYLTALISRLERPDHRAALLENLIEESGQYEAKELEELALRGVRPEWIIGIPHPELFQRFRQALGVSNIDAADDHMEVVCWRELFLSVLTHGSPAEALGALGLGTETIVQSLYSSFVVAIQRLGTLAPQDAVFFPLHTAVDDHHQATLKAIATHFAATAQGRADLAKGMHKALAMRDSFWGWLHERARAMPAVP